MQRVPLKAKSDGEVNGYHPFPIDWRFLPEPLLAMKDHLRQAFLKHLKRVGQQPIGQSILTRFLVDHYFKNSIFNGKIYIHIPKTGGSSIYYALHRRNYPHFTVRDWQRFAPDLWASSEAFTVIRHPIDRFVSAYHFLKNGGTALMAADRAERSRFDWSLEINAFVDDLYRHPDKRHRALAFEPQSRFITSDSPNSVKRFPFSAHTFGVQLPHYLGVAAIPQLNATHSKTSPALSARALHQIRSCTPRTWTCIRTCPRPIDSA